MSSPALQPGSGVPSSNNPRPVPKSWIVSGSGAPKALGFMTKRTSTVTLWPCSNMPLTPLNKFTFAPVPVKPKFNTGLAVAVLAMIGIGSLFAYQLRRIRTATYPMVRAVEGVVSIAVVYLVATSAVHVALSVHSAQAYTEELSRLDSVYFTVTMLTTVGFGDITPVTAVARSLTTLQMVLGVILVTGVVRVLIWVARTERTRRSDETA